MCRSLGSLCDPGFLVHRSQLMAPTLWRRFRSTECGCFSCQLYGPYPLPRAYCCRVRLPRSGLAHCTPRLRPIVRLPLHNCNAADLAPRVLQNSSISDRCDRSAQYLILLLILSSYLWLHRGSQTFKFAYPRSKGSYRAQLNLIDLGITWAGARRLGIGKSHTLAPSRLWSHYAFQDHNQRSG